MPPHMEFANDERLDSVLSSSWTALASVSEISPGQFRFTDPQALNNPVRFYRVQSL